MVGTPPRATEPEQRRSIPVPRSLESAVDSRHHHSYWSMAVEDLVQDAFPTTGEIGRRAIWELSAGASPSDEAVAFAVHRFGRSYGGRDSVSRRLSGFGRHAVRIMAERGAAAFEAVPTTLGDGSPGYEVVEVENAFSLGGPTVQIVSGRRLGRRLPSLVVLPNRMIVWVRLPAQ